MAAKCNKTDARRNWLGAAGAALLTLLAIGPVSAQTVSGGSVNAAGDAMTTTSLARRLNMGVGKTVILDLPRDASEIVIGNPGVANAVVRSARKLYVIGVSSGQTSIFAMDGQGHQIADVEVSIGRDIGELDRILKTAMPNENIVLRTVNDTIILTGTVDSAGDAQKAQDIAQGFVSKANATATGAGGGGTGGTTVQIGDQSNKDSDGKVINSLIIRGQDQVMLKVTVAEVNRNVLKQLGVTGSTASGSWGSFTQDNPFSLNNQQLTSGATTFGTGSISATLQAFERNDVARILAEPTVTAISGESAKFTAGGSIPVPQSEQCPPPGTPGFCEVGIEYKDYGVTLNFTPVVLSEGRILLHLATEVTEVDPTQTFVFQNVNVPGFLTRKNETSIELPSGGSIVTAGLLQTTNRQVINGLPGLMNLPILGALFRSRDYQRQETELMIMVTPYIAKAVLPGQVPRPDDGFADASDPQAWLLGRVNRLYSTTSNPQVIQDFKGHVGFIND